MVPELTTGRLFTARFFSTPYEATSSRKPELYNLDAAPYESLMIGAFSIWQGPSNGACRKMGLQKRNDILLGFSRDGFHWDRPHRKRFISCTWEEKNWRFGNVQSVVGGCLVVGDKLYFYFSGRSKPGLGMYDTGKSKTGFWDADAATGLATIRRDGFASMDAGRKTETLTTRPLTFKGKYLFVNVDCPDGELKAEALDRDGKASFPDGQSALMLAAARLRHIAREPPSRGVEKAQAASSSLLASPTSSPFSNFAPLNTTPRR
jgi:hypothetical protein